MQDLQQHRITKSGQMTDGNHLENAQQMEHQSPLPEMVGDRFGRLMVIDATPKIIKNHPYLQMRCTTCGKEGMWLRSNLRRGIAGCRKCGRKEAHGREALKVPKWLYQRAQAAQQRCINPNEANYSRYGGRGIEFRFDSPRAMAEWVAENLGLHREMEIDRIDNDGHYEPGNLRWATPIQNVVNSTKAKVSIEFHVFRKNHPEIMYADATLRRLLLQGMTPEQIIERFNLPSCKPKGVYGTFSTPDQSIVSLSKDC